MYFPALPSPLLVAGWFLFSYLLGSIPVAWIIARIVTGKDLRQLGSGNVGVMNTAISVARWAGLIVLLSEVAKGVLAVLLPRFLLGDFAASAASENIAPATAEAVTSFTMVGVVAGTRWPIWLGFKGGRGNSAGLAAILSISRLAFVMIALAWMLARLLLNNSFQATRVGLLFIPPIVGLVTRSGWYSVASVALMSMFLNAQRPDSDDHLLLKQKWASLLSFLTSPPRGSE